MYRAAPITQRDGSPLANSNCRMAACATGIDFHTRGAILSTGAEMRSRQSDQVGGTDSGDASQAWSTYGQDLVIRDGNTFDQAINDLLAGRSIQLDVWHATARGPCVSGSGAYGHSMAVAPERNGDRWLTADPWCSPASWQWWDESLLRAGAEELGAMAYSTATGGRFYHPRSEGELLDRMRSVLVALMTLYRPDSPAVEKPPATGGGGRIFYTATRTQGEIPPEEADDMAMNAAAGITSTVRADAPAGLDWFEDANLTKRGGSFSKAATVVFLGNPIGEKVEAGSRAVLIQTGNLYSDGSTRPSIVYVAAGAVRTYSIPPTPSTGTDVTEALEIRDAEWRERIIDQLSPGAFEG